MGVVEVGFKARFAWQRSFVMAKCCFAIREYLQQVICSLAEELLGSPCLSSRAVVSQAESHEQGAGVQEALKPKQQPLPS